VAARSRSRTHCQPACPARQAQIYGEPRTVAVGEALCGASTRIDVATFLPSRTRYRTATRSPGFNVPPERCVAPVSTSVDSSPDVVRTTNERVGLTETTRPSTAWAWLFVRGTAVGFGVGETGRAASAKANESPEKLIIRAYPRRRDVNAA